MSDEGIASPGGSVQSEVRTEHRLIDALFSEVREAFRGGDAARVAPPALTRVEAALDAHFEQEDRLYYPAIAALRPEHRLRLEACVTAHDWFRRRLRDLREQLERAAVQEVARALENVAGAFEEHEAAEEEVLGALDRE
jgi:hypothetical protein